jgi:hypothetical protein
MAALGGHESIVRALLGEGANAELRKNDGASASSVAKTE